MGSDRGAVQRGGLRPDQDSQVVITEGYTRRRHWEVVYHDLVDLYGPKVGLDGIGLWVAYKRFVQNNPEHLLAGLAWPSHRGLLAPLFRVGQTPLKHVREALADADLITVTSGKELAARAQADCDVKTLQLQGEDKPRHTAEQRITLADLAAVGIRNPARSLLIEVHDPLPFHAFCESFGLTYYPRVTSHDTAGRPVWGMLFDDYPGLIRGPNRILAAVRHISDNLDAGPGERAYWPVVSENQIRSLLRCQPDDKDTVAIRERLLKKRADLVATGARPLIPEHARDF